jgi:hypothetical protein
MINNTRVKQIMPAKDWYAIFFEESDPGRYFKYRLASFCLVECFDLDRLTGEADEFIYEKLDGYINNEGDLCSESTNFYAFFHIEDLERNEENIVEEIKKHVLCLKQSKKST